MMHPSSSTGKQPGRSSTPGPRPARELPECPICTMTVKDPKILPCGHSLCGPRSEEKCLLEWEKRQQIRGEITCPTCKRSHKMKATDAPSPFGFTDLLETIENMRLCEQHNSEVRYYCHGDKQELCDMCWQANHRDHNVELIAIAKWKQLCSPWERRTLKGLRKLCLEAVEKLGEGVDYLLGKQERYNKIADMCLSLEQKEPKIDQQFKQNQLNHNDEDIAEFELYIEHIKGESEKLEADLAKLDKLSAELKQLTAKTMEELKKRLGEEMDVGREDAPANQLPSTSTAEHVGNAPESEPTLRDTVAAINPSMQVNSPVPTDTIIAFGDRGKNEIWRRGTNKWTKWENGRDCGRGYACVKAHSNIYLIGGARRGQPYSPETDIYDISKEQWTKGPQLKTARRGAAVCFDLYNSQIIVVGGCWIDTWLNSVEILKVDGQGRPLGEWEQIISMKSKRNGFAAAILDDKLFVSGGYTSNRNVSTTASVEMLDLVNASADWKQCAPMNEKRGGHAMIAFNNELFVFGGWNGSNRLASCEKFSPMNNTWQKISNMRVPRDECGVCLMRDKIYVVGGYSDNYEDNKTVEVYNPDRDEWTEGPPMTREIERTKCVSW